MSEELDLSRGAGLEAARVRRGWSQNRLHKLSGISRRQIADAEKGKNLTCDTLKILMRALELRDITFDGGFTVRLPLHHGFVDVASLRSASEDIERLAIEISERLRECSAGLRHRTASATVDDVDLSEHAAQLVRRFAEQAAQRTPAEIDALSEMLTNGLSKVAPHAPPRQSTRAAGRGKRRKVK